MPQKRSWASRKESTISRISVAIVEPEFGLNLGYVARTMANFGLKRLIVVSKRKPDKRLLDQARIFASHGRNLVEEIEFVPSVAELRKKFGLLIGTTAIEGTRKANLTRRTLELDECASRVAKRISSSPEKTCVLFGRDTTGMTNEELRSCDYNMTIRASPGYNTLNVSHAAAITLFVFSKHLARKPRVPAKLIITTRKERERAVMLFEELAEVSEFQKFKSGLLKEAITRLFDKADPSRREVYLMMGLASKATSKMKRLSSRS